jgi:cyclopropane fatty-acyl-phospholipid synthase-like methyltransferase
MNKPFSQASENNKQAIFDILKTAFKDRTHVLEIGSGTGQHAVFFAPRLPHLQWQPSDRTDNHRGIRLWLKEQPAPNLLPLLELDVEQEHWPTGFDAVFSANTAHIMPWAAVQTMMSKVAARLPDGGRFALYGPFNYGGQYTCESNRNFDRHLRQVNPLQGIRDFEKITAVATDCGMDLEKDFAMPANNRLLLWSKTASNTDSEN